jgi:hypothetical protein
LITLSSVVVAVVLPIQMNQLVLLLEVAAVPVK